MIEVNRAALLAALEPCAKVADPRSTMPILANVLLEAKPGQLSYRATNLRHEVSGSVSAAGSGSIAVSARDLLAAVGSLEGDTVKLESAKATLSVKGSGRRLFKRQTADPSDFPVAMRVSGERVEFGDGELQRLIGSTLWSAGTDTTRAYLCVVRLESSAGKLTAAATDGASVAMVTTELGADLAVSIPADVARLVQGASGAVTLQHSGAALSLTFGGTTVACTQPEGHFPPLDRVIESIPAPLGTVMVEPARLSESLRAIRKQTDDVRLRFTPSAVELYSFDRESEDEDAIEAECSAEAEVWIPGSTLASALGCAESEVELGFYTELVNPLTIKCGNFAAYVMQRRAESVKGKAA